MRNCGFSSQTAAINRQFNSVADKIRSRFDPKLAVGPYAVARALGNGLITRSLGDTLAVCPPLIINEAQIGDLLARYGQALDAWVRQQGMLAA